MGGADTVVPGAPVVTRTQVVFSRLQGSCYVYTSEIVRTRGRALPAPPGFVLQVVRDLAGLVALVAPTNRAGYPPSCTEPGAPCALVRLP